MTDSVMAPAIAPVIAPDKTGFSSALTTIRSIRRDALAFFAAFSREHDGVTTLSLGFEKVVVLNSPDAIEHVFVKNWRNYRKSDFYNKVRPLFGNGIATSEGDFWRRQRQLMNPAFHRDSLRHIGDVMRRATQARATAWRQIPPGQEFDLSKEMTELSLDIVMESLFGSDASEHTATIARSVDTMLEICERRVWALPDLHGTWLSPLFWRHRHARAALDTIVFDIIEKRRRTGEPRADLLGMLLDARDAETGEGMSLAQLRDETTTLLVTGHESTANTLNWIFYVLAQHPDIEANIRTEIRRVCGDTMPDDAALREMPYMRNVIEEVMRLFPPAWTVSRTALEDDVIDGRPVSAGTNIMVSPYIIQRNPRYWPDPERFDPARFTPENQDQRPKFAYIPFGGGPRSCIGANFAMMELQIATTMLLQDFTLQLAPNQNIEREAIISIRPKHGIRYTAQQKANTYSDLPLLAAE